MDIDKLVTIVEPLYKYRRDTTEIKGASQLSTATNNVSHQHIIWKCQTHHRVLDGLDVVAGVASFSLGQVPGYTGNGGSEIS